MEELGTVIESCPCGHAYHQKCIREWINQKRVCPQCKADALPLITLHFNLFHVTPEEKELTTAERISSIRTDLSRVTLGIDTEVAEINVLEPQLAECRAEELAYSEGIAAREARKNALDRELEQNRSQLADAEKQRKLVNDEIEAIRSKLCRLSSEPSDSSHSIARRAIQSSEIPKVVAFMVADSKKLRDLEKESADMNAQLQVFKQRAGSVNKRLKELPGRDAAHRGSIKPSIKSGSIRLEGFVPIDAIGVKRKRDMDQIMERENKKPSLFPESSQAGVQSHLDSLSALVSILSDTDDCPGPDRSIDSPSKKSTGLDAYFTGALNQERVIVLE